MADQFLSQDEVDALLDGVDESPQAGSPGVDAGRRTPVAYDLAKQDRIVRGRMPTLEIVNERFARNLRLGLSDFMRRTPEVTAGPVMVQKYEAFLRGIAVPANINIVAVKPLRGNALVICDPRLVFTVVDNLFGGSGRVPSIVEGREFSATEQRIIHRMMDVALQEYNKAWQGIHPLALEYARSETNPQFATVAAPGEIVVSTTFALQIGEIGGELHVCIPYSTLEPIRETLYSALQGDAAESDKRWVSLLTQQIKAAEIELTAELAHANATVGELLALRPGDFISLEIGETVTVTSDGVPVFECGYGTSNGRYAVCVKDILSLPRATA